MNKHDRDNLNFLMSLVTHEQWMDWARSVDQDDIEYAMELIILALAENEAFAMELDEALEYDVGMDLSEAKQVLDKFKLR